MFRLYCVQANGHMPEKCITALATNVSHVPAFIYSACPLHGLIPRRLTLYKFFGICIG